MSCVCTREVNSSMSCVNGCTRETWGHQSSVVCRYQRNGRVTSSMSCVGTRETEGSPVQCRVSVCVWVPEKRRVTSSMSCVWVPEKRTRETEGSPVQCRVCGYQGNGRATSSTSCHQFKNSCVCGYQRNGGSPVQCRVCGYQRNGPEKRKGHQFNVVCVGTRETEGPPAQSRVTSSRTRVCVGTREKRRVTSSVSAFTLGHHTYVHICWKSRSGTGKSDFSRARTTLV